MLGKNTFHSIATNIILLVLIALLPKTLYNIYSFGKFIFHDFEFFLIIIKGFFVEAVITALIICILTLPAFIKKIQEVYFFLLYLWLIIFSTFNSIHILLFKDYPSTSIYHAIFSTNFNEIVEFILAYSDIIIIPIILILCVLWVLQLILKSIKINFFFLVITNFLAFFVFLLLGKINLYHLDYAIENTLQKESFKKLNNYIEGYKLLERVTAKRKFEKVTSKDTFLNQTYVFVLGESTSKHHMSLYRYPRKTNPMLGLLKNDLKVFQNVTTAEVFTLDALTQSLSFASYEQDSTFYSYGNLIELLNQAGFETYWISNQTQFGTNENLISLISKPALKKHFLTYSENGNFDEVVFSYLDSCLTGQAHKAIFIHLAGTHFDYVRRYPEQFNYFHSTPPNFSEYKRSSREKLIVNEYDNAVRYNDFIVSSMIDITKKKRNHSINLLFRPRRRSI